MGLISTLRFDWLVVTTAQKVVLKSTTMEHGALSVMTVGAFQTPRWFVDSWDLTEQLRPSQMPSLDLAVKTCPFFLMMSSALATRPLYLSASSLQLDNTTAAIMKTQESDATVS